MRELTFFFKATLEGAGSRPGCMKFLTGYVLKKSNFPHSVPRRLCRSCLFECASLGQNSEILGHLRVGDVMEMKYYTSDSFCPTRTMETEISHITREDEGRFQGHCLVGLAVPQG